MRFIQKIFLFLTISTVVLATINDKITRSVDLQQSTISSTTQYHISDINDSTYKILLSPEEYQHLSFTEVKLKAGDSLSYRWEDDATLKNFKKLVVALPDNHKDLHLVHKTIYNNLNDNLPKSLSQDDLAYSLSYKTYTHVVSPYYTNSMRVKIRTPTQKILKFGMTFDAEKTVKNGATVTYGPWNNVESYSIPTSPIEILYEAAGPRLLYESYDRHLELSHWGNAASYRDDIVLRNNGPTLKGHFTRLTHQAQTFLDMLPTNVVTSLEMRLPSKIKEAFYVDQIGNVTTSVFRPSTSSSPSVLQVKPRFPLLGGWKYSFSVGFETLLRNVATLRKNGDTRVTVPFSNIPGDVAVDKAETRIILPEGANIVDVILPFKEVELDYETTYTYLDTIGRPTVVIKKSHASDAHNQDLVVIYNLSMLNAIRKPITVGLTVFLVFLAFSLLRRINTKI